jgi:hypothetical protein
MILEYLNPIDDLAVAHARLQSSQTIGQTILLHTAQDGLPDLKGVSVALICVLENRKDPAALYPIETLDHIRTMFYELYPGNWTSKIADLGNILPGNEVEDTYYVVRELTDYLVTRNIIPFFIGGSQDLMYPIYRSFDETHHMINVVNIDSRFDLGNIEKPINNRSYIGKMVANEPYNLFNYSNLGFQTYYNSQDEIDLLDRMYFDAVRLGDLDADLTLAEPILRDADVIGIDAQAIKSSELFFDKGSPNGLNSVQMCRLSRYSGISDRLKAMGIFEIPVKLSAVGSQSLAQVMWYFMEGYNYRSGEYPVDVSRGFLKYKVPIDDEVLIFYKSSKTGRWWIELPFISSVNNKLKQYTLLPCDKNDYLMATDQVLPDRWLKARQKNEI